MHLIATDVDVTSYGIHWVGATDNRPVWPGLQSYINHSEQALAAPPHRRSIYNEYIAKPEYNAIVGLQPRPAPPRSVLRSIWPAAGPRRRRPRLDRFQHFATTCSGPPSAPNCHQGRRRGCFFKASVSCGAVARQRAARQRVRLSVKAADGVAGNLSTTRLRRSSMSDGWIDVSSGRRSRTVTREHKNCMHVLHTQQPIHLPSQQEQQQQPCHQHL